MFKRIFWAFIVITGYMDVTYYLVKFLWGTFHYFFLIKDANLRSYLLIPIFFILPLMLGVFLFMLGKIKNVYRLLIGDL